MATESSLIVAADHNFRVLRGDFASVTLDFFDSVNQPMDFTGATIKMQARKRVSDASYIQQWTIGNGISVSGNSVTISKFELLPIGVMCYDLQVTFPSGDTVTYIRGIINVVEDATK